MIYKWRKNSVEAADQKSWRLYQFDFMGLRNTTDIIQTTAGRIRLLYGLIHKFHVVQLVDGVHSLIHLLCNKLCFHINCC